MKNPTLPTRKNRGNTPHGPIGPRAAALGGRKVKRNKKLRRLELPARGDWGYSSILKNHTQGQRKGKLNILKKGPGGVPFP